MRSVIMIAIATALVGASAPDEGRDPAAQAKLDKMLADRTAGKEQNCVDARVLTGPVGIDDRTLLFLDGRRIWRTELRSSLECGKIGPQAYIMTDSVSNQICAGKQIDFEDGGIRGACVLDKFTPYSKP